MDANAGDTITPILTSAPQDLVGTLTVAVRTLPSETVHIAATTDGITETQLGDDTSNYQATIDLPVDTTPGDYEVVWLSGSTEVTEPLTIHQLGYDNPGDPYFTVAELRAEHPDLADATTYPAATIEAARDYVERRIENICGVAFVPRDDQRTVRATYQQALILPAQLRAVTAVTADDTAWTTDELADLDIDSTGVLYHTGRGWNGQVTVEYQHGYDAPPVDIKDAAMIWTRERVLNGAVTARATQLPTVDGGVINLATPGLLGSYSGIPEVDEVLTENLYRASLA